MKGRGEGVRGQWYGVVRLYLSGAVAVAVGGVFCATGAGLFRVFFSDVCVLLSWTEVPTQPATADTYIILCMHKKSTSLFTSLAATTTLWTLDLIHLPTVSS